MTAATKKAAGALGIVQAATVRPIESVRVVLDFQSVLAKVRMLLALVEHVQDDSEFASLREHMVTLLVEATEGIEGLREQDEKRRRLSKGERSS